MIDFLVIYIISILFSISFLVFSNSFFKDKHKKKPLLKFIFSFSLLFAVFYFIVRNKFPFLRIIILFITFLLSYSYFFKKNKLYSFIKLIIFYLYASIFELSISYLILFKLLGFNSFDIIFESTFIYFFLNLSTNLSAIIFSLIFKYLFGNLKISLNNNVKKLKVFYVILIQLSFTFLILIINILFFYKLKDPLKLNFYTFNTAVTCFYVLFNVFSLYLLNLITIKVSENTNLKSHIKIIESLSDELRVFKHDYLNILAGIDGYIKNKDYDNLNEYINNILEESKKIKENNFFSFPKIKNSAISGLLSEKINESKKLNIHIKLNILNKLKTVNCNINNLITILGVFLDNAIEATRQTNKKELIFDIINTDEYTVFIIKNNFKNKPNISKIFNKNFSTKNDKSGLGLYTVKSIIDQEKNTLLNTYFENKLFVQELIIYN